MAIDSKRVKDIFLAAAELPDEAARAAYMDNACAADAELRARVEALLRSPADSGCPAEPLGTSEPVRASASSQPKNSIETIVAVTERTMATTPINNRTTPNARNHPQ